MTSKIAVCFLSWSIRGDSWQRATVIEALDTVALPRYDSQRLDRLLRKHVRGATIVYAQRGHRPQYAIVRGIADVAGLRAGHVEPLAWFRYDTAKQRYAPCVIRSERADVLRALQAFNDEKKNDTATSRELGVLLARQFAKRFPLLTVRNGGGLYACCIDATSEEYLRRVECALNSQTGHAFTLYTMRAVNAEHTHTLVKYLHDCTLSLFSSVMKMRTHEEKTQRRKACALVVVPRFNALSRLWYATKQLVKAHGVKSPRIQTTDHLIAQLAHALGKK